MIFIYTDGSCRYNPGPGAFAWARVEGNQLVSSNYGSCGRVKTTNNRAEMIAVIEALKTNSDNPLTIVSDSQVVVKGATGMWKKRKNKDLWREIDRLTRGRSIVWKWVKGHNSDRWNDYVDGLAQAGCA